MTPASPIAVLVNHTAEFTPSMTTVMLIEAATRRGHPVLVCGVSGLSLTPGGRLTARAHLAPSPAPPRDDPALRAVWLAELQSAPLETVDLDTCRLLLIRTNPARDSARAEVHRTALALASLLATHGVPVINAPDTLARAHGKVYPLHICSEHCPATLVTSDPDMLRVFMSTLGGPTVLKPVTGTRGRGVFLASPGDPNLGAILETLLAGGTYVLAQAYVPGAEAGDIRVILLHGRILEVDGKPAAIRRLPRPGDFRANLHTGGRAEPAELTPTQRAVAQTVGRRLAADGIILAGLDLIGDHVIEANIFSPGGLRDAERFYAVDFCDRIIRSLVPEHVHPPPQRA